MNVLLIEDDAPLAHTLAALLRPLAKKIIVSGTLERARHELDKPNGFDVVFIDINLPDSDAATTTQIIDQIKRTGRRAVMITASHSDMDKYAEICGADACFYKWDVDFVEKLVKQLR